jgi:hypothetical protein
MWVQVTGVPGLQTPAAFNLSDDYELNSFQMNRPTPKSGQTSSGWDLIVELEYFPRILKRIPPSRHHPP